MGGSEAAAVEDIAYCEEVCLEILITNINIHFQKYLERYTPEDKVRVKILLEKIVKQYGTRASLL